MKLKLTLFLLLAVMIAGCGVKSDYVAQQIAESEQRIGSRVDAVDSKATANSNDLTNLKALAAELESKTDMALNEAKGFENYQVIWEGTINFDYDSYEIDDVAAQILDEAGQKMGQYGKSLLEVVGHTDGTGSKKYNLLLGEKRSNSAKRYLADNYGISLYRMFVLSYGESKPIALPDEQHAASRNRRVHLKIWGQL